MTKEEAIKALTSKDVSNPDIMLEALEMAIEALKQESKKEKRGRIMDIHKKYLFDESDLLIINNADRVSEELAPSVHSVFHPLIEKSNLVKVAEFELGLPLCSFLFAFEEHVKGAKELRKKLEIYFCGEEVEGL